MLAHGRKFFFGLFPTGKPNDDPMRFFVPKDGNSVVVAQELVDSAVRARCVAWRVPRAHANYPFPNLWYGLAVNLLDKNATAAQ